MAPRDIAAGASKNVLPFVYNTAFKNTFEYNSQKLADAIRVFETVGVLRDDYADPKP